MLGIKMVQNIVQVNTSSSTSWAKKPAQWLHALWASLRVAADKVRTWCIWLILLLCERLFVPDDMNKSGDNFKVFILP